MSAHTPGPWQMVESPDLTTGGWDIEAKLDDGRMGTLCTRFAWDDRIKESRANGRLIAAAPDLLGMLREVEKKLSSLSTFNSWDLGPSETLTKIRDVIAKAEGR